MQQIFYLTNENVSKIQTQLNQIRCFCMAWQQLGFYEFIEDFKTFFFNLLK